VKRRATVRMPGTCGELVQGYLEGIHFHVSCPVNIYSTVEVELDEDAGGLKCPSDSPKASTALRSFLAYQECNGMGGTMTIHSMLPRSKGMASSTADVAGAIYAAGLALGREIVPSETARLALGIEPSDGSLFPNIVLFDHREGRIWEDLGPCPPLEMVILDFGGEVDTVAFNRRDCSALLRETEPQVAEALALVREGLGRGDVTLIGQGATLSALANQHILPKPQLDAVLKAAEEVGSLGVNVAHSGTILGVLLDPRQHRAQEVCAWLERRLPGLNFSICCRLTGGGPISVE
ncbi:MAG: GHMP kinase, partial [Dehalococcoidia bacterium]|nr:GHMP kinase [Dehalococcoidia bacterium]